MYSVNLYLFTCPSPDSPQTHNTQSCLAWKFSKCTFPALQYGSVQADLLFLQPANRYGLGHSSFAFSLNFQVPAKSWSEIFGGLFCAIVMSLCLPIRLCHSEEQKTRLCIPLGSQLCFWNAADHWQLTCWLIEFSTFVQYPTPIFLNSFSYIPEIQLSVRLIKYPLSWCSSAPLPFSCRNSSEAEESNMDAAWSLRNPFWAQMCIAETKEWSISLSKKGTLLDILRL